MNSNSQQRRLVDKHCTGSFKEGCYNFMTLFLLFIAVYSDFGDSVKMVDAPNDELIPRLHKEKQS